MPIYDYRCDPCDTAFSAVRSYQDDSLESCPRCGAPARKLLSSPAIVFKGSGWYKTDSRRGSADAKADAKADGRGEGKTEGATAGAKPAAEGSGTPAGGAAGPAAAAKPVAAKPAATKSETTS